MNNGIQGYPDYPKPVREFRFGLTEASQTLTIPMGISHIEVEIAGAKGGYSNGGRGAIIKGILGVDGGELLSIYVGGRGGIPTRTSRGWNGGGRAGTGAVGGSGGGATDIRIGGTDLEHRVVVAGGGGGGGSDGRRGGDGGNPLGGNGEPSGGSGGGGSLGSGQDASQSQGSGGGGGYYGGGAGANGRGGGGGSSLIPVGFSFAGWNDELGGSLGHGYAIIRYYGGDEVR